MRELEDLLPTLQPPAGGLTRLQRHIVSRGGGERMPRKVEHWVWAAAACVPLAIAAIVIQPLVVQWRQTRALTAALREAMSANSQANGIRVTDGAVIELPSGQANVKLYMVQAASSEVGRGAAQNDMK